jgi:hypothetical protein
MSLGNINKPTQYLAYLTTKVEQEDSKHEHDFHLADSLERYHNTELRHEIEKEFHSNEHQDDEEDPVIV